jgi:glycosyltransferase involved in cell wall biosynthesis
MEQRRPGAARLTADPNGEPLVSVLLCTYNDEATIEAALQSALDQTADPGSYRVVAVDDGSTDATGRILDRFARGERVEVVHNESNRGLVPSCNIGLERIGTPFVVRLDGDDRFEAELVEELLRTSGRDGANLVYTDRWEVGEDGSRLHRRLSENIEVGELIASGTLLPTGVVKAVGGYRELFWEEFDLYIRLLETGECRTAHVGRPLYSYTVGAPTAMTSDARLIENGWRELRELWPRAVLDRYGLGDHVSGVPGRRLATS